MRPNGRQLRAEERKAKRLITEISTLKDLRESFIKGDTSARLAEVVAAQKAALIADFNRAFLGNQRRQMSP